MLDAIEFVSGHKMIDNSVGDYDLVCPTTGARCFVPYMISRCATADKTCPFCNMQIGERNEAP